MKSMQTSIYCYQFRSNNPFIFWETSFKRCGWPPLQKEFVTCQALRIQLWMNKNSLVSKMQKKTNLYPWIAFLLCVILHQTQQVKSFFCKSNYDTCSAWSLLFIAALTLGNTPLNLNNNKILNASIDLRGMTLF